MNKILPTARYNLYNVYFSLSSFASASGYICSHSCRYVNLIYQNVYTGFYFLVIRSSKNLYQIITCDDKIYKMHTFNGIVNFIKTNFFNKEI